jgi:hypothetical protein
MSACAQCHHVLPPIHGRGIGLRFCGVKCCKEYHSPELERRMRDEETLPFTVTQQQTQLSLGHKGGDFLSVVA